MPSFQFRAGTPDPYIFRSVVEHNEYRLPPRLGAEDTVIDIGAHIGSFSLACLLRGAGKVYAIEVVQENADLLRSNLAPFADRTQIIQAAVWRSDLPGPVQLTYESFPVVQGIPNTGGTDVVFGRGPHVVHAIALDTIIEQATQEGHRRIRLIKIDAECSEWPILLTSQKLGLVDAICGEFHEMGGSYDSHAVPFKVGQLTRFTADVLQDFLEKQGFSNVTTDRKPRAEDGKPGNSGLFFASRLPS